MMVKKTRCLPCGKAYQKSWGFGMDNEEVQSLQQAYSTAESLSKEGKNACQKNKEAVGIAGTLALVALSAATGYPLFLLSPGLGLLMQCDEGKAKIKQAIQNCSMKHPAIDAILMIRNLYPGQNAGNPPMNYVPPGSGEAELRHSRFSNALVELLTAGMDVPTSVIHARGEAFQPTNIAARLASLKNLAISGQGQELTKSDKSITEQKYLSLVRQNFSPARDLSNDPTTQAAVMVVERCLKGIAQTYAKEYAPEEYKKFKGDPDLQFDFEMMSKKNTLSAIALIVGGSILLYGVVKK